MGTENSGRKGHVLLHRSLIDSRLWSYSDATFRVAIYLLLETNHKEKYYRGVKIDRGQTIRSITQISEDCNLSRKAVRYAIQRLKDDGFLEADAPFGAQQGHRLTICNYDVYQSKDGDRGIGVTHEGNTNNNDKNDITTPPIISPPSELGFFQNNKKEAEKKALDDKCEQVMQYLNDKAGRSYRVPSKYLRARLAGKDLTVQECKDIIDCKCDEWLGDENMERHLAQDTLFRASKFDKYREQAERWIDNGRPSQRRHEKETGPVGNVFERIAAEGNGE